MTSMQKLPSGLSRIGRRCTILVYDAVEKGILLNAAQMNKVGSEELVWGVGYVSVEAIRTCYRNGYYDQLLFTDDGIW